MHEGAPRLICIGDHGFNLDHLRGWHYEPACSEHAARITVSFGDGQWDVFRGEAADALMDYLAESYTDVLGRFRRFEQAEAALDRRYGTKAGRE